LIAAVIVAGVAYRRKRKIKTTESLANSGDPLTGCVSS
jgi:hypothetical protein